MFKLFHFNSFFMKKSFIFVAALAIALLVSSCASTVSPVMGGLYTNVRGPIAVTASTGATKVGSGTAKSILGIIAIGDASIEAAAKEAGITRIHHVDYEATSILSFYATYTVLVYGE